MSVGLARPAVRLARIALAVSLLLGALAVKAVAFPGGASACSCVAPEPGAPVFTGREQAVFIGTADQAQPDGTFRFRVEHWFQGGNIVMVDVQSETEVFADGSTVINTCGVHFEVGDHLIMAASLLDGTYTPTSCSPHAVVESPEGQRLIAAAVATFGEGAPPGAPPDGVSDGAIDSSFVALVALAAIGIVVLLAILAVVYAVARRGSSTGTDG